MKSKDCKNCKNCYYRDIKKSYFKWNFLDWKNNGIPRTKDKAIKNAGNYLMKIISKNNILNENSTEENLIKLGYKNFISAIEKRKLSYNKILLSCGFKANRNMELWDSFDWDESGKFRTKREALINAVDYFMKNIMSKELKLNLGLENNEAPTRKDLDDLGYKRFFSAIYSRKINYNDILREAGLKINLSKRKWSSFNWSVSGDPRTKTHAIDNATNYFLNNILTEDFKQRHNLGDGEAPVTNIKDKNFVNFLYRGIYPRGIHYNDVLLRGSFILHENSRFAKIGRDFHWIAECIFLEHTRKQNCYSFYEAYLNKFSKFHSDNLILVDDNLRNLIDYEFRYLDNIRIINIDYFLGSSKKRIKSHCVKAYQGEFMLLILVPLNLRSPIPPPVDISYRNNVKVMDPISFLKFFRFECTLKNQFMNMVNIVKKATYMDDFKHELEIEAQKNFEIIRQKYNYGQMELEKVLKNKELLKSNKEKCGLDSFL